MSTSIIAFLLLTKFRTVSVVNCVLHLIVGLLIQGVTSAQLAVEYKWMVQEAGSRGRWALFVILKLFIPKFLDDVNTVDHQSQQ